MAKSNFEIVAMEIRYLIIGFKMAVLQTDSDFDEISFIGTVSLNYCTVLNCVGNLCRM